jgi:hypothetical protein
VEEAVMRSIRKATAALLAAAAIPVAASAAVLGGADYAVQYDYREFFAATDRKPFQVVLVGNPFPNLPIEAVARSFLPQMQAAKPPPALTFTYDRVDSRPDYRLVLVFDPANDLGADAVCRGGNRLKPGRPGVIYVFAVYCRNDAFMSQVTAWTPATSPDDPSVNWLFRETFATLFDQKPALRPQPGQQQFR